MDDDKAQNQKGHGNRYSPILVAVVGATLGSSGTVGLYLGTPVGQKIARPDPFTGSQAASLTTRLETLEKALTTHVATHPDQRNQFDRRIATLEAQYPLIMQSLDRIESRLDKLK